MELHEYVVVLAFAWLLLEITVFPVPAESSCFQLLFRAKEEGRSPDALGRAREKPTATKLLLYLLPTTLGVALFLVPLVSVVWEGILAYTVPLPALHGHGMRSLGIVLILAGRSITFLSVLQLRGTKRRPELHAHYSGLFRYSRNPGLVGMFVFYLGLCCVYPSVVLFAGFVPYFLNMHRRVLMEESWLLRTGNEEFADYLARVPRYLIL